MSTNQATIIRWTEAAAGKLVGRKIESVHYLTEKETEDMGFQRSTIALILDDGNYLIPSADDEGNDAGALFTSYDDLPTIPVI